MTRAPASRARSPVASTLPSSTTMISCQAALARKVVTTGPIASASFTAGITTETADVSAKEPLDDAIPRDRARTYAPCLAEPCRECLVAGEAIDDGRDRLRLRVAHEPVRSVDHEFEHAAGIGRGDDRLRREKRLERHVSVILVVGRV